MDFVASIAAPKSKITPPSPAGSSWSNKEKKTFIRSFIQKLPLRGRDVEARQPRKGIAEHVIRTFDVVERCIEIINSQSPS
jgi:hypothetical protein